MNNLSILDTPEEKTATLNDAFRDTLLKNPREISDNSIDSPTRNKIVLTLGINSLSHNRQVYILNRVKNFKDFNKGDDPYGERDFGAFKDEEDVKIFWKIDYYDNDMKYHSPDKTNPDKTIRVLTIMKAEEY
tara:strand:+ start:1950 stop:2345 length:396 start_codon:yes stop_codon:yes gene_type:complete